MNIGRTTRIIQVEPLDLPLPLRRGVPQEEPLPVEREVELEKVPEGVPA